ncbi:MAG: TonB-dependent receptor [Parvibaculales bacterium]
MRSFKRNLLQHVFIGASAALFMAPVHAQETATESPSFDEIVVTVERREQSLQDLGGTAASFDNETLKSLNLTKIQDLDGAYPGLNIANNQGNIEVWIRGVGSSNNTELGDPAAATHMDGVYVPRPSGFGSAFFDIQRVEVNFGPQGTLRGRQAMAGSVNVIPFKPGLGIFDAMVEVGYGSYNEKTLESVVNLPVSDNSAFRLAYYQMKRDSYYSNASPEAADVGLTGAEKPELAEAADNTAFRASYYIEPTERLSATFTFESIREEGTGYTGTNYANPLGNGIAADDIDDPRTVVARYAGSPEENTSHKGYKVEIDYETDWFDVEFTTGIRDLTYDYRAATPLSPVYPGVYDNLIGNRPAREIYDNYSFFDTVADSWSRSQELRFVGNNPESKLTWSAGIFRFIEKQKSFLGSIADTNHGSFLGQEFNQRTLSESEAVYFDGTYELTDHSRITAGVRRTEEEKDRYGVNATYRFALGGWDGSMIWGDVGTARLGTQGFEFAKFDRTIYNPDTNGDGTLTGNERVAFFLNGVSQFGANDNLDEVFGAGVELPGGWWYEPWFATQRAEAAAAGVQLGRCVDTNSTDVSGCLLPDPANGINWPFYSYAVAYGNISMQNGRIENDFTDWRLRYEHDIDPDWMAYAVVATGHKAGGFNDNIEGTDGLQITPSGVAPTDFNVDTLAPQYDSEKVIYYEIGSKREFEYGDTDVRLNVNLFYYDYEDMVLSTLMSVESILGVVGIDPSLVSQNVQTQVVTFNFNASNAEIMGLNVETGLRFNNGLNLDLNAVYMDTEVKADEDIQDSRYEAQRLVSIDGNELPRASKLQLRANLSQSHLINDYGRLDWIISAGYRSSQYMTLFNSRLYGETNNTGRLDGKVDGYWTFDAGLGFSPNDSDKVRLEAYVNNITDEVQPQAIIITQRDNTRFFNRPRTAGVRLRLKY